MIEVDPKAAAGTVLGGGIDRSSHENASPAQAGSLPERNGYGELAWGLGYALHARNEQYQSDGEVSTLIAQAAYIENLLSHRDDELARMHGEEKFTDVLRGRVCKAWGSKSYNGGQHTCFMVHNAIFVYPIAEFVKLVREGGEKTAELLPRAQRMVPMIEEVMKEFDDDWRPDAGCYVNPKGKSALPHNQYGVASRALFLLSDITGKPQYLERAQAIAKRLRSHLTVTKDNYFAWTYDDGGRWFGNGQGEDISHAALTAHCFYVAWQHHSAFDDEDMQRLTRTFTRGLNLGRGRMASRVGDTEESVTQQESSGSGGREQCARWVFLARFDPQVETLVSGYLSNPSHGRPAPVVQELRLAMASNARRLAHADLTAPKPSGAASPHAPTR